MNTIPLHSYIKSDKIDTLLNEFTRLSIQIYSK